MPNEEIMTHEQRAERIAQMKYAAGNRVPGLLAAYRRVDSDADEDFARDIYADVWRVGLSSQDLRDRQACVEYLLEKSERPEDYLRGHALTLLQSFHKDDFSHHARAMLARIESDRYTAAFARVTGVAECTECLPRLNATAGPFAAATPALKVDPAWNAALALARMGDTHSLNRVIERVEREEDVVLRSAVLFQDLGYTKSPRAFSFLRSVLGSSKRLPNPKNEAIPGEMEAGMAAKVLLAHARGAPDIKDNEEKVFIATVKAWADSQTNWPVWR